MTRFAQNNITPILVAALLVCLSISGVTARENLLGQDGVPYGAAADYLMGRQLLKEGQFAEALGYLHLVYRTHPDVPAVAEDFQEALVAEGYFQDAVGVMDRLISTYPDSLSYLLQRSRLNLQLGKKDLALSDLRTMRDRGGASLEVIMAEASILAASGEPGQALDVYRDGVHLLPEKGDQLYLAMAALLQREKQVEQVVPLMEQAVSAYPENPQLWLVWVRALALTAKHEEALAKARQADEKFGEKGSLPEVGPAENLPEHVGRSRGQVAPPEDTFLVELADFYVQQGQVARAVAILEGMSKSDDLGVTPSLWLARIYIGTGQFEPAKELISRILARWPDSARGWFLQGKLVENQDDWEGAIPIYTRAAELGPHDPEIRVALVRAMIVGWEKGLAASDPDQDQLEKRALVEKHAVAALTLVADQDTEGHLVLGYAFRRLHDPWRAEASFALAAADKDVRISAVTQRSLCLDEIGETGKARQVLEELQQEYPENPEVANSLGYYLAEKGEDLEQAQDLIAKALETDPGNGAYLDSMGWVKFRMGQVESAFDYMIQAVNVLPDDPVILEHLGMVLLKLGQTQEGSGMLQRALALGGDKERLEAVLADLENQQAPDPSGGAGKRQP